MSNQFKQFIERRDVFGFEELDAEKEKEQDKPQDDDKPIKPFSTQWFVDVLSRQKIGGRIKSSSAFLDEIVWGEKKKQGSVRVRLTPNISVYIERLTDDLLGAPTWILKRVFKPKLEEYAGREEIVAKEVFAEVEQIFNEKIDSVSEEHNNFLTFVKRVSDRVKGSAPLIYDYQDTKEINKDYYIVYFNIRSAGVGKLLSKGHRSGSLSPEITIDINFNRERGLIHIIMATVSYGAEGQGWVVDIPYLDSWYAPSQSRDEIIDTLITTMKFY
jgi:hypothetical protein